MVDMEGVQDLPDGWIRPALLLGVLAVLITLNVLEFRGKRRQDARDMQGLPAAASAEAWFARKQYLQTQNIEQVLHIVNAVLIVILVAILTA